MLAARFQGGATWWFPPAAPAAAALPRRAPAAVAAAGPPGYRGGVQRPLNGVLGPGAEYEGDLSFEGRVRIDGRYRGRLYTEDVLEIGRDGRVEGAADVAEAIVAGAFTGELRVRERLVLEATAVVRGKVDAGVVEVRPGARLEARVRFRGEALP